MTIAIALALAGALAAAPEPPVLSVEPPPLDPVSPWELGVAVGGGWGSSPASSTTPTSAPSAFGAVRAWLARELWASDSDVGWLQLRYDGTRFDEIPDASWDRPELSLEWGHRLGERFTVRLVGAGALRVAADPARSGWEAGARAMARLRVGRRLGLRAGGGYAWFGARDAAYTYGAGALHAGLDVAPWPGALAVARYAVEAATGAPSAATGSASGWRGGAGAGRGTSALLWTAQSGSIELRQDLWGGLFVQAACALSAVRAGGTSSLERYVAGELGWSR